MFSNPVIAVLDIVAFHDVLGVSCSNLQSCDKCLASPFLRFFHSELGHPFALKLKVLGESGESGESGECCECCECFLKLLVNIKLSFIKFIEIRVSLIVTRLTRTQ